MKQKILMLFALVCATSFADTIHLKSGSTLSGKVTAVTNEEITFDSDDLGEVTIKVANIVKLEDAGEHVVLFNNETRETKKLAVEEGAYLADGDTLVMGDVKAIDPGVEVWHGSFNLAFSAIRGNTYENSGSVIANLNRRWEHDRVRFDGGYYLTETGKDEKSKEKTTERWEIEAQEDHFWTTAFYSYLNGRVESDKIAELDSRIRLGLGAGYQWLDGYNHEATGKWSFNQEAGANWVREDYATGESDSGGFAALRYAHHLTYNPKWNDGVECFHNFEYLPEVDDWEKYLAKADVGFTTKIIGNFDLLAKIEWDYNSKPATGRKKSDYRYIVGLGYKW